MQIVSIPPSHQRLLEAFLARRSANTRRSYEGGLKAYAAWLGTSPVLAASSLIQAGQVNASASVLSFLEHLANAGRSSGTLASRLNALRALVQVARIAGLCSWSLEVPCPLASAYRDTRGPGRDRVMALIHAAGQQKDATRAARDVAILRLLYDLGLRCVEVSRLRAEDFQGRRLMVRAKGAMDFAPVTLPEGTAQALQAWMTWRGRHSGPLFHRLDRAATGEVLDLGTRGIWHLVSSLARKQGFEAWPHGLRHSAITDALDAGFDLRSVFRFGRWKGRSLNIVAIYDDNRQDLGAAVSDRLARSC